MFHHSIAQFLLSHTPLQIVMACYTALGLGLLLMGIRLYFCHRKQKKIYRKMQLKRYNALILKIRKQR